MTEITWSADGQRYFEAGVDRGVLYPRLGPGVPWNGLTAVSETPNGGGPIPFYADGYKYLNLSSAEEFQANLSAFSAPSEFGVCDGTQGVLNGLFITQQPREQFGLSYRTKVGNDTEGADHGYKLHLVYNCLASPSARNNQTLSKSVTPLSLSWDITTTPPDITGYRPSAHFVIDSRYTPDTLISQFEGMLYGTATTPSFLPTIPQLMALFNSLVTIQLWTEGLAGAFGYVSTPAIRSDVMPTPAPGQSVLWLDTSAGYSQLTLVTGE
jgi:hypothetical protein